jgi:lipoprotein-anchoring transpeptidase ErfK/SrfK
VLEGERCAEQPDGGCGHDPFGWGYAIHGTNKPESIGTFASYGCIRMLNQDITDLFERITIGTQVVVMR